MTQDRRKFLSQTTRAAIAYGIIAPAPIELLASLRKKISPNDKIQAGVIGCKGQGWSNLTSMLKMPEVECIALCDVDQNVLSQRRADLQKLGSNPVLYEDYRQLLNNKDIDVVIIATPDHWHCLQLADACNAGKHVLAEKPLTNYFTENHWLVNLPSKYKTIVQVNQWQRSQQHFKNAVAFVRSGKLGNIHAAKCWMYRGTSVPLPPQPNEPVPAGVNYDLWLGPATKRPFNKNRFHYEFRWFWDYAGGLMTDWGVHLLDIVLMGVDKGEPLSIYSSGGKYIFPDDARETPDIQTTIYDFKNFQLTWEHSMATSVGNYGMQHGIAFIGENGTLLVNRGGWEVRPNKIRDQLKMEAIAWQPAVDHGLDRHTVNFIEAVKTKNDKILNCNIDAGAQVSALCHLGNVAYRVGEKLNWQIGQNKFDNEEANKLLTPVYENGWKLVV